VTVYSAIRSSQRPAGHATGRLRPEVGDVRKPAVKKLIILAVIALGVAAIWRKVQADRAELDLWTEATTSDE
jgi:hypothetical protein